MKKILLVVLVLLLLLVSSAGFADDSCEVKFEGMYIKLNWIGTSSGEYAEFVLDSLPFQLPEEGGVIMLQCLHLGDAITPEELRAVVGDFKLYNRESGRYLTPAASNWKQGWSRFELFFHDSGEVRLENYSLFSEDEEYTFGKIRAIPDRKEILRGETDALPTMPPDGEYMEAARPEYCLAAEELLRAVDEGSLAGIEGSARYGEKVAVVVFDSNDLAWKSTLKAGDGLAELLPADRLAGSWDEADTVVLIRKYRFIVGRYGIAGKAYQVDTKVTVVDRGLDAAYPTYTAVSSDPPESIQSISNIGGNGEGTYEYVKAIEEIAEQLGR